MKRIIKPLLFGCGALMLWSCSMEEPFKSGGDSEALVKFNITMSQQATRAEGDDYNTNCVIYISNSNGLLHKWKGTDKIPTGGVYFRYGNYLAEAFAGDSVAASFSQKYLKGETPFEVKDNQLSTQVTIVCKLANVAAAIDVSEIPAAVAKTIKAEISSSTGKLTYEGETLSETGYFMRNYDSERGSYDSTLTYSLSGTDIDGTPFSRSGEIKDVEPGHLYTLNVKGGSSVEAVGGTSFQIVVKEYELEIDESVIIHGKPEFAWANEDLDIDSQLYNQTNTFEDNTLFVAGYGNLQKVILSTDNEYLQNNLGLSSIDLVSSTSEEKQKLEDAGIEVGYIKRGLYEQYKIKYKSTWLNAIPSAPKEYVMNLTAVDSRGMQNSMKIRIATNEEALDAPFAIKATEWKDNYLSVKAHSVIMPVNLYDDVNDMKIRYKRAEAEEWTYIDVNGVTSKGSHTYELTGLDEDSEYECQIVSGTFNGEKYQFESSVETFRTEGEFKIPNAGMEEWYQNGKYYVPMADSSYSFWDSGNKGSTTISSSDNLTVQFTGFSHGGNSCAQLTSKFVGIAGIGKHGAASLFTGSFVGTEKTTHGIIDLGREYNGTHPKSVKVYVNYRPKTASKGADDKYIKSGELDKGQIYIALSTKIHRAQTAYPETLITQENLPEEFIAYGQRTFESDFGEKDDELEEVVIDFEYFDSAKTEAPKYLIILCAASKYGDYFSGGEGSTMYVDDFELIYE